MTKKTIPELDPGADIQTSAALVAFSQDGTTFNGPVRPNAVDQINVRNQAQLEAELGMNLEIPDGESRVIVIDDEFTLTTPIKLGVGSGLHLTVSKVSNTIDWAGAGAMIQNINPGVDESFFVFCENVDVSGDGTNSFIDIKIDPLTGFVTLRGTNIDNLGSIGTIDTPAIGIDRLTGFVITQGLVILNAVQVNINIWIVGNFAETNTTWLTIIPNASSIITLNNIVASNSVVDGDSLIFLDPNSPIGTTFVVTSSRISDTFQGGIFYQLGTDIVIDSVANEGGFAEFTSASAHELVIGTPVVLSAFGSSGNYNDTFVVTSIPTATTFQVGAAFDTNEPGNMNKSSLDQTSIEVKARDNTNSPDSKNIGSLVVSGNATSTTITTQNEFTDLNLGTLAVAGSNIERWIVTNTTTGEMQYIGIEDFNGVLNAVIVVQPNSTDIFDIRMLVNGSPTVDAVSSRSGTSQSGATPVSSIPFNSPLSVVTGDLVRLQILNEDGVGDPTITDLSIGAQNP